MIETVVKRDGTEEAFDAGKLNKWAEFAADHSVDWSEIALTAYRKCYSGCTTKDLHKAMIDACVEKEDHKHLRMAGRLLLGSIYKEAFGSAESIPSLYAFYSDMVESGHWSELNYTEEEFDKLDSQLNHGLDESYNYTSLRQIADKYLIKDRVTDIVYESPQFMFMGMAMQNMEQQPKERRLKDVLALYNYLSEMKINAPTPMLVNMRTRHKGYASCCVYTTEDSAASLSAGDHIAYMMTCASAGIGGYLKTRSRGDGVRSNTIKHMGKLPYLKVVESSVHANLQSSRGGAATMYYSVLDPEIFDLLALKNPMTVAEKRIKDIDYALSVNKKFAKHVAKGLDWMLISYAHAPDLHEAFYSGDEGEFETLYEKYLASSKPKQMVKARDIAVKALTESVETGRLYLFMADETNRHTPFKDKIYSSNLCVAPETKILTDKGEVCILDMENQSVNVFNGEEFSNVTVRKTGENKKLLRVTTTNGNVLDCTEQHRWYLKNGDEVRTTELKVGDKLLGWNCPDIDVWMSDSIESVEDLGRVSDTYCFTEPERGMGVFNNILTGQCLEIALPTKGYTDVRDLYSSDPVGEIGLCSLASIVAERVGDSEYEDVAYYTALMIDNVIEIMEYPFESLERTAKARRSIGVGITNLAHAMAKKELSYSTQEGKTFIHRHAEKHSYWLHRASLRLAKEKGVCEWANKTKYVDGWLPIDTYNKNVDEIVDSTLQFDWESLREDIKEVGGLRNSVLEAMMPVESSSQLTNTTNSIYPIRNLKVIKTSGNNKNLLVAPDADELGQFYDIAWDLEDKHLIDTYAVVQKFTGQAISADQYIEFGQTDRKVPTKKLLQDFLYMVKMGMKTRYYLNSASGVGESKEPEVLEEKGCSSGGCTL